jgi:exonuclease SbcD
LLGGCTLLRFVHAADLHLDTPFTGLSQLPSAIRQQIKESTFVAFDNLVELCLDENVDFLILSGDTYDAADRSLRAQLYLRDGLTRLSQEGISTFIVHGNHDPLDGYRAHLDWPEGVTFFSSVVEGVPFFKEGKELARIFGISYSTGSISDNLSLQFKTEGIMPYTIAILHTNVGQTATHGNYAPCSIQDLTKGEVDYWALGHIHLRQVLRAAQPAIVYPGNIQGRSWKETGAKGCYIVEVDERRTAQLSFRPLDVIRWTEKKIDISSCTSEQALLSRVEQEVEQLLYDSERRSVIARLELVGDSPLFSTLSKHSILEDLLDYVRREQSPFVWIQSIRFSPCIRSEEENPFIREMQELISGLESKPDNLKALLFEAAKPLQDHRLGRRWAPSPDELDVKWLNEIRLLLNYASNKGREG